jgi:uncharacterized protein (TIGR02996 family)
MTEEAFLSVLRDHPGDEGTWSALADWLDDSGQSERAELLRLTRRPRTGSPLEPSAESARGRQLLEAGVKPVTVTFTNSIGMRFVLVQPGAFLMGSPADEADRGEDESQHAVTITRPFWLGVHPVTQGQWKAVMGNNPSHFSRGGGGNDRVEDASDAELDLFPVESVAWLEAQDYLTKLAALDEGPRNRRGCRLPSEAEWEYACRGGHLIQDSKDGHTLPFHFGRPTSSPHSSQANFDGNYPYGGAARGRYLRRPCRVGSYRANVLGLFDMHGNVWEWCADWYGEEYDENGPSSDPSGPHQGSERVNRGGSWCDTAGDCRAARRSRDAPRVRGSFLGFRVAAVPHE